MNPQGPKDMVCIILYVSLTMQGHGSTKARDGHRCIPSETSDSITLLAQAVLVQVSGSGIPQTWLVHERH